MNHKNRAAELADAERFAYDLDLMIRDYCLPGQQASGEPEVSARLTARADRPLLQLAGHLSRRGSFAPTPIEQARLRRRFEQLKQDRRVSTMQRPFQRILKPTLQTELWAVLLLGVFAVIAVLLANLLGKPANTPAGPAPVLPGAATAAPTATLPERAATPTPLPKLPNQSKFPVKFQTVNEIHMELREVARVGDSLRVTLCYVAPDDRAWRMEGVELWAGETALPFYPSSSVQPVASNQGPPCETFTAENPGDAETGKWAITIQRLVTPRESMPDCQLVSQQLAAEFPGLSVHCFSDDGFGYSIDQVPDGMDPQEAQRLTQTYTEYDILDGPWSFTLDAADIVPLSSASGTLSPVVVPSTCDPSSRLMTEFQDPPIYALHYDPAGIAGGETVQSGDFTFQIVLACDPNFSRLRLGGIQRSEINGLGVLWKFTYQGEPINGEAEQSSGIWPFVLPSGSISSLDRNASMIQYQGLQFPVDIRPDFTQSDVRLRYLVKIRTPDGAIEGAALAFTLQRAPEGYRPVDVKVEPLTDAERQTVESDPSASLPFPTLPAPVEPESANTQALRDLVDGWQKPLLAAPGWVHLRTRTEMPGGNGLYAGLTEYTNDDWFQIDAQGLVVTYIHIDRRLDGTVLQQSYSQNGKTTDLTFGNTDEFKPYPLVLTFAVQDMLKAGDRLKRSETSVDGKPAILFTLPGIFTRREAVDAASGAWLYSENVKLGPSDDPASGGILENRITIEAAERVDAPPAEALALLGKEFSGYTPPAPYGTPAPQGFDPSKSKLTHQIVYGDDLNAPSFWYGDLYAEGYLLGRVDFGGVPGGWCARSSNGSMLAFSYYKPSADGSTSSTSLRWFDLRSLNNIHQPAQELVNLGTLSWSPTEEILALSGCKADQKDCGLYLLDPATDSVRLLLPDVYAYLQPIWNPDGSQVAFVDTLTEDRALYVIDIHTGKVIYQGQFDTDAWQAPADSPTVGWGLSFPRDMSGGRCFE